jgi:hypothetical protein
LDTVSNNIEASSDMTCLDGNFEQAVIGGDGSIWTLNANSILLNPDESSRTYSSVFGD